MAEAVGIDYALLRAEPWWGLEYEPDALAGFNVRLRSRYGHTAAQTGSKGDNRHLSGRHRSMAWCLNSQFCVRRSYGTTDRRDTSGPVNALRATDWGMSGPQLWAACRRVDAAARAGELPGLAEWFGTFDGTTVVGWFEGHPSTSDSSHRWHGHFGYWTSYTDDRAFFDRLYELITGDDEMTPQQASWLFNAADQLASEARGQTVSRTKREDGSAGPPLVLNHIIKLNELSEQMTAVRTAVESLAAGQGNTDVTAVLAGVDARLAAQRAQIEADTRDAIADLAERGAVAVRADAPDN